MHVPYDERDEAALHALRLRMIEEARGDAVALASHYPDGHHVADHRHSRAQLLHPRTGVVLITTDRGRWIVPPDHAMWIPPGVVHSVDMIGAVAMHSIYVLPGAVAGLPEDLRVLGMTGLVRHLIDEAVRLVPQAAPSGRDALILQLILSELPGLREQPLALPFPGDARLAGLCRQFLDAPSAHAGIDAWAESLGMSRRTFTRRFAAETGLSFSAWRQQACVLAALPRLAAGEPVTSVALDLGYDSVPAFTTMFKRLLGKPPRAWLGGER